MNPKLLELHQTAMRLPLQPGVYLMRDATGKVIYVGKARALKNRVSQYFAQGAHDAMDVAMVERVVRFDHIVTTSEHEALVLECSLIKQHAPKYNILLKDDKGYRYIRVTREAWPRLGIAKQKHDDGATYLGPYTNGYAVKLAVEEVRQIFKLPVCSRVFPRDIGRGRPCLQFFIQRCSAPCGRKIGREAYAQSVRDAVDFLKKGSASCERALQAAMERAADALDFELAARLRDRIRAVQKLREKQSVVCVAVEDQDVFALATEQEQACWMVLRFRAGRLCDSEPFFLPRPAPLDTARQALLERYYAMREDLPKRVLLDEEIENAGLIEEWLSAKAGHKVVVQQAQKAEPLRLVQLCRQNALEQLAQHTGRKPKDMDALEELAALLGLPKPPQWIEAYDISHMAGADNVCGMVVFARGAPYKKGYRRFAIQSFAGQDDYASLVEAVTRRLQRFKAAEDQEGFGRLPDLILLDGGVGQVHAVAGVLEQFGVQVPLFGMVKDGKHKTRAIAAQGGEIALQASRAAFALVTRIQDEVHRFAVAYHHKKHTKTALQSELLQVPGIGEARAKALFLRFKTIKAMRACDEGTLATVVGQAAAHALVCWFLDEPLG